ncbi:MAG: hypothetical protein K2K74_05070 [Lachnospiraceae bacterium]|nr:hypothetical protein [Lachnospiraceae bacterium]
MKKDSGSETKNRKNAEIAYQNKDITSKFLAENLKGKTFGVYGLDLPEVEKVLPTNIPTVKANELRLDNLFALADGTAALVDYESEYNQWDKVKYLNYITGIANRCQQDRQHCPPIRMIVIYTGDIERRQVSARYDIGAVKMTMETAFLSELDSEGIFERLKEKVEKNQPLTDEELMQFIILPLSYRTKEEKQEKIQETVELAVKIQDRKQQFFALSGILVFTDKIIDMETANRIRRRIDMTQVAQIFEEEKRQAVEAVEKEKRRIEKEKQQIEEEKQRTENALKEEREKMRQVVIKMIQKKYSAEEIISYVSNYSQEEVEQLRKEVML